MARDTKVILSKGGGNEREMIAQDIGVHDLWHLAEFLKKKHHGAAAQMVLDVWHLAHDLKRHIVEQEEPSALARLAEEGLIPVSEDDLRVVLSLVASDCSGGDTYKHAQEAVERLKGKLKE
jgi:hypothetical protein